MEQSRYVYRALNEYDNENIENMGCLKAAEPLDNNNISKSDEFMGKVVNHIRRGSDAENSACWISACKDFNVCATEYAIPQNGAYNTAKRRKNIAVIDISSWIFSDEETNRYKEIGDKKEVRNYTVFVDKNKKKIPDLCINDYAFPDDIKVGRCNRSIEHQGKREGWNKKKLEEQVLRFKGALESSNDIAYGILDCSQIRTRDNATKTIQELPYFDMAENNKAESKKQYGIIKGKATAVDSGIAITAGEVLFLNEIPGDMIKCVLRPWQQDLLYMVDDADKKEVLEWMININNEYTGCLISKLKKEDNDNIERQYQDLVDRRKEKLLEILKEKFKGISINKKLSEYRIPEEAINVKELTQETIISRKELYDLLAVRYNDKLYKYEDVVKYAKRKDILIIK